MSIHKTSSDDGPQLPTLSSHRARMGLPLKLTSTSTLTDTAHNCMSPSTWRRFKSHLFQEIDPTAALPHLSAYSFHTGLVNAITFSAIFVWSGFQSANTVLLGISLARLIDHPSQGLHMLDRQTATSLSAFVFGAFLARPAARFVRMRWWLLFSTFVQALFLGSAALSILHSHQRDKPPSARLISEVNWANARGFIALFLTAASVGLQGATVARLKTPFGPAVPLTSTWVDLALEPAMFELRMVYTREARSSCIFATFVGGFVGRALVQAIGTRGTIGCAALLKVAIALSWLFARGARDNGQEEGLGKV